MNCISQITICMDNDTNKEKAIAAVKAIVPESDLILDKGDIIISDSEAIDHESGLEALAVAVKEAAPLSEFTMSGVLDDIDTNGTIMEFDINYDGGALTKSYSEWYPVENPPMDENGNLIMGEEIEF